MSFRVETPPHLEIFTRSVETLAPNSPIVPAMPEEEARATARQRIALIAALGDGLDNSLPAPLAAAINIAEGENLAQSVVAEVNSAIVGRVTGAASAAVGNSIAVLEHAVQSLNRVDAMLVYLLSMEGYVSTLTRSAMGALNLAGAPRLPEPAVPSNRAALQGALEGFHRAAYMAGRARVARLFADLTQVPREAGEAPFATRCLIALMDEAGHIPLRDSLRWRAERAVTRIIYDKILHVDLQAQRAQLRRWAVT